jgi:hypothetical protein
MELLEGEVHDLTELIIAKNRGPAGWGVIKPVCLEVSPMVLDCLAINAKKLADSVVGDRTRKSIRLAECDAEPDNGLLRAGTSFEDFSSVRGLWRAARESVIWEMANYQRPDLYTKFRGA